MYVLPLIWTWLASWLESYFAEDMSAERFVIAPCLAKSLTHAPSRPTTSGSVLDAAPDTSCCLVDAYGALNSLTLIFGFCAVKSDIIFSNEPVGSSAPLHCANSSVTGPLVLLEFPLELQATPATPTIAAAATSASSRFGRLRILASPAAIVSLLGSRSFHSLLVYATLTASCVGSQGSISQDPAKDGTYWQRTAGGGGWVPAQRCSLHADLGYPVGRMRESGRRYAVLCRSKPALPSAALVVGQVPQR